MFLWLVWPSLEQGMFLWAGVWDLSRSEQWRDGGDFCLWEQMGGEVLRATCVPILVGVACT